VSATLLTLLVLPTVYPWFDRRKDTSRLAQLHERETQFAE
jgi:cobalt-zinc-cadmium resistance protein CzcA